MKSAFRRRPDVLQVNYTESHQGRGADYDESFAELPLRSLMWRLEQAVLADLLASLGADSVLDFACGTGRVTDLLARELPTARVMGVDVAESMLAVARERVPGATFVCSDGRELREVAGDGTIDLVTAFRFFPNADPALRVAAADAVAAAVRPGGHLLFNNHRNFWSPSYLARRIKGSSPAEGARNAEMVDPFLARGFTVVARHSLGVLPQNDERLYLLPDGLAPAVEGFNQRRLSRRHTLGTNTIWLMRKDPVG